MCQPFLRCDEYCYSVAIDHHSALIVNLHDSGRLPFTGCLCYCFVDDIDPRLGFVIVHMFRAKLNQFSGYFGGHDLSSAGQSLSSASNW